MNLGVSHFPLQCVGAGHVPGLSGSFSINHFPAIAGALGISTPRSLIVSACGTQMSRLLWALVWFVSNDIQEDRLHDLVVPSSLKLYDSNKLQEIIEKNSSLGGYKK